jgi:Mycothiol maleylpyruvate isomerase N-terminal domain
MIVDSMRTLPSTTEGLPNHPYGAEMEAERTGWYEIVDLVRSLTPQECVEPGYQRDPDWTVRDLVAHVGTWLAEAQAQFERMRAGTYDGHDVDVDSINAALLAAMHGQPWEVAWVQANAARTRLLDEWYHLPERTDEAAWWVRKSAAEHYAEHLGRLREWVGELTSRRTT